MRKTNFAIGEYYHIYNRGVDKRDIFLEPYDLQRFFQCMTEFNTQEPIGSIYENSFRKVSDTSEPTKPLVEFFVYCLNSNHFHFGVKQVADRGVEKFMHRLGGGYTMYFNNKNKRSGSLFQGKFKARHVDSNDYLLHLSAYINGNNQLGGRASKLSKSSMEEYLNPSTSSFCNKSIILGQFSNIEGYKRFLNGSIEDIGLRKQIHKDLYVDLEAEPPSK